MQKLKKMDTKMGQTVFSFKCPCGSCRGSCLCPAYNYEQGVKTQTVESHYYNATHGGSATGGAGM